MSGLMSIPCLTLGALDVIQFVAIAIFVFAPKSCERCGYPKWTHGRE